MQHFVYNFTLDPIPPIMKRGRHALIVVKNADGKYLLGAKDIYPEGIFRFVGGGIDGGEDPAVGAAREIEEELLLKVEPAELKPIAQFTLNVTDTKESFVFETFVYFLDIGNRVPTASDDIQSLVPLTKQDVFAIAERYKNLPSDLITLRTDRPEGSTFRWRDYGKFYSEVHRLAMELVE